MSKVRTIMGVTGLALSAAGGIIAGNMTREIAKKEIEKFDVDLNSVEREIGPTLAGGIACYSTVNVLASSYFTYMDLIMKVIK